MRIPFPAVGVAAAPLVLVIALAGCMGTGGGGASGGAATQPTAEGAPGAVMVPEGSASGGILNAVAGVTARYCPELRVREGTEVLRRYEEGHEDDPAHVVWQASISNTARQCTTDGRGNMLIRIGISGRVIAGPKGGPSAISAPLRIAVVKYQEAVLHSDIHPLAATIPAENSVLFSEVKEVAVPSPGTDRDYIIYVGFDDGQEVPVGNPVPVTPTLREQAMEGADLDAGTLLGN